MPLFNPRPRSRAHSASQYQPSRVRRTRLVGADDAGALGMEITWSSSLGDGCLLHDVRDDAFRAIDTRALAEALGENAMGQYRQRQPFDVVGNHVFAPFQQGQRLAGSIQGERCAGAAAEVHVGVLSRCLDKLKNVIVETFLDADCTYKVLQVYHVGAGKHRFELIDWLARAMARQDFPLRRAIWIADATAEQEAVQLAFR